MKTFRVMLLLLVVSNTIVAQDSLRVKQRHHELGLDLSSFIKYYFNFGQGGTLPLFNTPYYLHYRFHLPANNNIRAALGGGYSETEITSPYVDDQTRYKNTQQALNYRLGFEHFENISPKFQVFYGLDLNSGNSYQKNDAPYWNAGYANGVENKNVSYGVSALLGLRYKLNKRLSIFTESSILLSQSRTSQRKYYIPLSSAYLPLPDVKTNSKTLNTAFNFPLFIVIAVDL
ncbi:MAG: hypothetical protein V4635_02830 [Bacteroidota bacterium]